MKANKKCKSMPDSNDKSDIKMSVNILTDSKPKAKLKSILKKKGKKTDFLEEKEHQTGEIQNVKKR